MKNKKNLNKIFVASKLPDSPGVYFFKKGREILYIGKASSLRDRVRSYFSDDLIKTRGPAIVDMVTQSNKILHKKTDSVLEALILESELIKKHQPRYNVKEKDDKSYNHVVITNEKFPRILIVRGRELKNSNINNLDYEIKNHFGPFTNGTQLRTALRLIQRIFPFFDTAKPVQNSNRINLNIEMGLYPDIFSGKVSQAEYKQNIRNIVLFFKGKKKDIIRNLKKQMMKFAELQKFEKAAEVKNTIFALNHINDVSILKKENPDNPNSVRIESYDIAHLSGSDTVGVMVVYENGKFKKTEYKKFIIKYALKNDDYGSLTEIIERRFKHPEWKFPKLIIVDGGKGQRNAVIRAIEKNAKIKIPIISVVKNEKHQPREILGPQFPEIKESEIIKINAETHRFAIAFHRKRRNVIK